MKTINVDGAKKDIGLLVIIRFCKDSIKFHITTMLKLLVNISKLPLHVFNANP